jgi:hypothetical protein
VYLHRKATRGLRGSTSSAARMKGMTSGATERGTCCPASGATPAGSLRDTSVLANASHLRLGAAAAADDVDAPPFPSPDRERVTMMMVMVITGDGGMPAGPGDGLYAIGDSGGVRCGCGGGGGTQYSDSSTRRASKECLLWLARRVRRQSTSPLGFLRSVSASVLESGKSRRYATAEASVLPLCLSALAL